MDESFKQMDYKNSKQNISINYNNLPKNKQVNNPGTSVVEARKDSISFTLAGPDSVYINDSKVNF